MKKTLFAVITMIGSVQAAASPSYWDRFTSWWGSTTPSQYIPSAATCSALGSKLKENPVPTAAAAGAGLLGLGYMAYRYAQSKPNEKVSQSVRIEVPANIKQAIDKALSNSDKNALYQTLKRALADINLDRFYNTPEFGENLKKTEAILQYTLAAYKQNPRNLREFHDIMFSIYNAAQETARVTRSELLFGAGNPYEVQALYNSVADLGAGYAVQQAEFDKYYEQYQAEKLKLKS